MEPDRERLGLDAEIGEEARGIADALLLEHEELIGRDRVERQPVERARHGLDRAEGHVQLPYARAPDSVADLGAGSAQSDRDGPPPRRGDRRRRPAPDLSRRTPGARWPARGALARSLRPPAPPGSVELG